MSIVSSATLVFFISMISRYLVSFKFKATFDVYGHLCFVDAMKSNKLGPYDGVVLNVVGASPYSQPGLWHWLVGFFNVQFILRNQAWLNGLLDSIFVVISFLLICQSDYGYRVAFFVALVYLTTPIWFSSISLGPRISGFTPRLSSEILCNLFFLFGLLKLDLPFAIIIVITAILAFLIISSSKFGIQALFFLALPISILTKNYVPCIGLGLGLIVAILLSKGRVAAQLNEQKSHLIWFFKENLNKRTLISQRNSINFLFSRKKGSSFKGYVIEVLHKAVSHNSFTAVLIKMPVLVFVIYWLANGVISNDPKSDIFISAPILVAFFVFLLINLPWLLFLGEAERYLNHIALFICIYFVVYSLDHHLFWMPILLICYGISYWLMEIILLGRLMDSRGKEKDEENTNIIEDLKTLNKKVVVFQFPYTAVDGIFRVILETGNKVIYPLYTSEKFSSNYKQRYNDGYPFAKIELLDQMASEYGIEYIIVDRTLLAERGLSNWVPSDVWHRRSVGGNIYEVYERLGSAKTVN